MNQRMVKTSKASNKVQVKSTKITVLKTFKVSKQSELLAFLFEKITNDSKNNIKRFLSNKKFCPKLFLKFIEFFKFSSFFCIFFMFFIDFSPLLINFYCF